jgi:hypothetical protein
MSVPSTATTTVGHWTPAFAGVTVFWKSFPRKRESSGFFC